MIAGKYNQLAGLTVSGDDAGKTLLAKVTIDADSGAEKTLDLKFKVTPLASSVKVSGVKNGKLSQTADTTKEYDLTISPKKVADSYVAEVVSAKEDATEEDIRDAQHAAYAQVVNGKLEITTFTTVGVDVAKIVIYSTKFAVI